MGQKPCPELVLGELCAIMPRSDLFAQTSANKRRRGAIGWKTNPRRFSFSALSALRIGRSGSANILAPRAA